MQENAALLRHRDAAVVVDAGILTADQRLAGPEEERCGDGKQREAAPRRPLPSPCDHRQHLPPRDHPEDNRAECDDQGEQPERIDAAHRQHQRHRPDDENAERHREIDAFEWEEIVDGAGGEDRPNPRPPPHTAQRAPGRGSETSSAFSPPSRLGKGGCGRPLGSMGGRGLGKAAIAGLASQGC